MTAPDNDLNTRITQAAIALNTHKLAHTNATANGKIAEAIDGTVDCIKAASESSTLDAVAPLAAQTAQVLQAQLDTLASASKALTNALDELGKLHPFVLVVVTAFKVAWKFEMTRRQNDKRVLVMNLKMNDMLSVMLLLRNVAADDKGTDGMSISDRLSGRMKAIARDIENCAAMCDTFSKKGVVVKLFRSFEWESKLTGFMDKFDDHRNNLQADLAMHASIAIQQINMTVDAVSTRVQRIDTTVSMSILLQQLRSPRERKLIKKIELNGGPERVLNDKALLRELIVEAEETDTELSGAGGAQQRDRSAELAEEVIREVGRTFEEMVKENDELFSRKFRAQAVTLREEMTEVSRKQSTILIQAINGAINSGPYERVLDPDLSEVWKASGWKETTKARHLVMALREYYAEQHRRHNYNDHQTLEAIRRIVAAANEPDAQKVQEIGHAVRDGAQMMDEWALQYISISRIQPLIEAFDDDASSLVSISEVNAFTAAKPDAWSLPHWMAYWTAGFPLVLRYYFIQIQVTMARIAMVADEVLPTNALLVTLFTADFATANCMDRFLCGVHAAVSDVNGDYQLFDRFKDYVFSEEAKMEAKLEMVMYCLDAVNTLDLVTNAGRLEKHLLPLIYILLRRALRVIRQARHVPLHPNELGNIVQSLWTVWEAIEGRVQDVKAVCKLQNIDPKQQLLRFSYGMYYYVEHAEEALSTDYWTQLYCSCDRRILEYANLTFLRRQLDLCRCTYDDLDMCAEDAPDTLLYPSPDDSLHLEVYDEPSQHAIPLLDPNAPSTWSGSHIVKQFDGSFAVRSSAGVMHLCLPTVDVVSGLVTGGGTDYLGDFIITGAVEGSSITFTKQYLADATHTLRYHGKLSADRDEMEGDWGSPAGPTTGEAADSAPLKDLDIKGRFEYRIAPMRLSFVQPNAEDLASNRSKALWRFACDMVKHLLRIRRGHFSWEYLRNRRTVRKRFLVLFGRLDDQSWALLSIVGKRDPLSPDESAELATLVSTLSENDFKFYKRLSAALKRRRILHWGTFCDACQVLNLDTTRFACLDCLQFDPETQGIPDQMDFCQACVSESACCARDGMDHVPSHAMLRLRRVEQRKLQYATFRTSYGTVCKLREEEADDEANVRSCASCETKLEPPFWICTTCSDSKGNVFICMQCQERMDKDHTDTSFAATSQALTEPDRVRAAPDSKLCAHGFWDTLILYQSAPKETTVTSVTQDTASEELSSIRGQLETLQYQMEQRMDKLEQMLIQALGLVASQGKMKLSQ